jgi:copper(I)-binding protein
MALPVRIYDLAITVAAAGTAVPLSATAVDVKSLWLRAAKVGGANTGKVYVGISTVDQSTRQIVELDKGVTFQFPIPDGATINLADVYVDAATNADGVVGLYTV